MLGRRGQAAVETLIAMPVMILMLVVVYQLWGLLFAAQNAHIRAREALLHGRSTYMSGPRSQDISGFSPFLRGNYTPAFSKTFYFEQRADDWTIPGVGESERVRSRAILTSR